MMGRLIQDNWHMVRKILEGLKDNTKAVLINLDQSKAFDRVDHQFLATVLEAAGFKLEFCKWISILYHNLQAVIQVNRKCLEVFMIEWLVRQGCPLSLLLYVLTLEPLLNMLRGEKANPALHGVLFVGCVRMKVSAYADDIPVFVSHYLDILAGKKVVEKYEEVAGAKINFDKSEGLPLPRPLQWSDGPILGVWFGPCLQLEQNWSEVWAKVESQVGTWL